jgi:hypothetical protein
MTVSGGNDMTPIPYERGLRPGMFKANRMATALASALIFYHTNHVFSNLASKLPHWRTIKYTVKTYAVCRECELY